jgi:type 1 glutamine amidotransferase
VTHRLARIAALGLGLLAAAGCNVWRVSHPSHDWEREPPALPAVAAPAVLVFSKTNGYRHDSIPAGAAALQRMAARRGWGFAHTESSAAFTPEVLGRFAVTVWLSTSGPVLSPTQQEALRSWLEAGHGFVGIHAAGGDFSYEWRWYVEDLIGAQFIGHPLRPDLQAARVITEDPDHPATRALPGSWSHTDEWYSFQASPRARGAHVLLRIDEQSYSPRMRLPWFMGGTRELAMGDDHPVAWTRCAGRGRVFYSALGHPAESYASPEQLALLEGAIAWAARLEGEGCEG